MKKFKILLIAAIAVMMGAFFGGCELFARADADTQYFQDPSQMQTTQNQTQNKGYRYTSDQLMRNVDNTRNMNKKSINDVSTRLNQHGRKSPNYVVNNPHGTQDIAPYTMQNNNIGIEQGASIGRQMGQNVRVNSKNTSQNPMTRNTQNAGSVNQLNKQIGQNVQNSTTQPQPTTTPTTQSPSVQNTTRTQA